MLLGSQSGATQVGGWRGPFWEGLMSRIKMKVALQKAGKPAGLPLIL